MHILLVKTKLWATVYAGIIFGAVTVISAVLCQRAAAQAPTPFLVSPYFGQKTITQPYQVGHPAYDFSMNYERVLVAADGTVDQSQWYNNNCHNSATWPNDDNNCGYGLYVRVNHGNNYRTIYGHLSAAGRTANAGVTRGQIIGTSGNTGWSTGPHLHFQVQHFLNNIWTSIDPFGESGVSLWIDGEWGSPSRPILEPINGGETFTYVTIASTGGFSKGENNGVMPPPFNNACMGDCANWTVSTSTNGYKYSTLVNGNTPDSWAKWQAPLPAGGGMYEVFVYIPSGVNAPSWRAPYTIRYLNNVTQATALVDQYVGNHWVSLGIYYMTSNDYVFTTDATGETAGTRRLSADAVKFVRRAATYTPYVNVSDGWFSTLVVRNNGGGPAQARLLVFNRSGAEVCNGFTNTPIPAHGVQTWIVNSNSICPQAVAATVDGSQDLAITIREENGNGELNDYNGIAASASTALHGWEKTGPVVYAPVVKKSWWSRTSKLLIMNAGQTATTASIQLYKSDGSVSGSPIAQALAVWGSASVSGSACADPAGLCSARISASNNQPLAVVVLEQTDGTTLNRSTHNAFSFGTTANYLPLARKNANGQKSVLWIQNVGAQLINVSVTCYDRGSQTYTACASASNVPSMKTVLVDLTTTALPDGFEGSCQVTSSGQPLATIIHETGDPNKMSTSAPQDGSLFAIAPEVYGSKVLNSQTWDSSLFVQNVGGTAAQVTVTYYNEAGGVVTSYSTPSLASKRMWKLSTWDSNLPANFKGSAVIQSTQKVAGLVNTYHTGSGDTRASYIVSNR